MSENIQKEIDLAWLMKRFKGCEDWISARDVSRKGYKDAPYSRDLMAFVVSEGKATPNEFPPNHQKYKIRLVNHKSNEKLFDDVILSHPLITDLPPRKYLIMDLTSAQHQHWNNVKSEWILIYKAFCRHQNGLGVEDFSKEWSSDFFNSREGIESSRRISLKTHFFICTYKLLKLGWQEIEQECPAIFLQCSTYNDAFLKMLFTSSRLSFELCFKDIPYRPRSMYEYLRENLFELIPALDAEAAREANREKISEETRQRNHEQAQRLERLSAAPVEGSTDATLFEIARGWWIEEALRNSTNPSVQDALRVWRESEVAISENTLSELNYERNSPKSTQS
jgi:hypothetical protein